MARPISNRLGRIFSTALFTVGTLVAVTTVRMLWDGHHHLTEGRRHLVDGDRTLAIVALESAAKAYVPGGPHTPNALLELEILARSAEMRGEVKEAAHTWEVIRRAVLSTRHVYQPNGERLEEAEREIVRLSGLSKGDGKSDSSRIRRPNDPSPVASILLFLGVLCWILGATALLFKDSVAWSKSQLKPILLWGLSLGGLCLWLLMAWLAG